MKYEYRNGKEHLHLLGGQPLIGVSTAMNVVAKPLTWWAAGKALEPLGWLNPKKSTEEDRWNKAGEAKGRIALMETNEYKDLLQDCYRAHDTAKNEAAEKGTDRHALVEEWVKAQIAGDDRIAFDDEIKPFKDWAEANVKRFLWSEMNCFSSRLWVGGICDIGYETKDGKVGVLDVKSSKDAYPTQFFQCAGYATLIEENGGYTEKGEKIFDLGGRKVEILTVFPFGAEKPWGVDRYDVDRNKQAFEAAVTLHKQINNYE